jgi:hypothetical protein
MHCRTAWNDYFPGTYSNNFNSETYYSRPTLSGTGIYVSNCLFISIISTSDGGALSCTSTTYLLVESSSFFSCKTSSDDGGALCVRNGQCVLNKVCGYDCYSTYTSSSYGQFSYNVLTDAISNKNYINYSSIVRCVTENSNAHYTICHHYGTHCCPSINSSMNKCGGRTGIYCCPYKDTNSVTCTLSHSSFADNNAIGYTCISFCTTGANYEIKSCNILRNTQGSLGSQGTIYTPGNTAIDDSCILENKATYTFYAYSSYIITLSNSTVDSTSKYGSFKIQNTATKSFILALDHISTQNCNSEYDSFGTLTPIIHSSPSSKKRIYLCTCGDNFLQPRLSDVVSLTSILIFNFIHPHTSIDPFY